MTGQCIEIVSYRVNRIAEAEHHRKTAKELAAKLPGFGGWLPLRDVGDHSAKVDIVIWTTKEAAEAAAETINKAEDFADFRATIAEIGAIGHYTAPADGITLMQPGSGIEFGRFRMREDVREEVMRPAHANMVAEHLSLQPGWLGQRLVRLQDGTFMDVAFAVDEAHAQAICNSWAGNAECDAFLRLVEPLSMEFGALI